MYACHLIACILPVFHLFFFCVYTEKDIRHDWTKPFLCRPTVKPEMGKAQFEVQLPQLRRLHCALIFYFETLRKLRCGLHSSKFVAL